MNWQFGYGKHGLCAHADSFKRVYIFYERTGPFSVTKHCKQNQAHLGYNGSYQAESAWTKEDVDKFWPHERFQGRPSSLDSSHSQRRLNEYEDPSLFVIFNFWRCLKNTKAILRCWCTFYFQLPMARKGSSTNYFRHLELARVLMDTTIVLTRKTNPFHGNGTNSSVMEASLVFTRNRQNLGPRYYDAYGVLNTCLCFLRLTTARLTRKQTCHSDFALQRQRKPP